MRIRRLELRNFRKFIDPVAVEGLGDGLTVIAGDNEEGKSTLLKALRTVLFDRHRLTGESVESLRPFGSTVRPEVHLDFDLDGQAYRLRKGFCQQQFAEMDTPSGRINGPAVEEALQTLLRFEPPGKGPARTENQGIWGLFWLEQGTAFANVAIHTSARQTVLSALEGEVGAVLGGQRGRDLLDTIGRHYSELFDARGNPRGAYKKSLDRVVSLQSELAELDSELRGYDAKVDELARARDRLRRYEAEGRLGRALREREDAEQEQRRLESLAARLKEAEQYEQVARAECKTAASRWERREEELRDVVDADATVEKLVVAVQTEQQALAPQDHTVKQARESLDAAAIAQEQAEVETRRWERMEQRTRVSETLSRLRKRYTAAFQAFEQSRQAHSQAAAISIDEKRLRTLRRLEKESVEAEAGLNAIATRLTFTLEPGVSLRLSGKPLAAGDPLLLTETSTLQLDRNEDRLGSVTITPGAEDLGERKKRAELAGRKLAAELAALDVPDVAAAEVKAKERADLETHAQQQQQLAAAHAAEGLDSLREAISSAEAELSAAGEPDAALDSEDVTQRLRTVRTELDEVTKRTKRLRSTWERESLSLQAAQTALTKAEADLKAAEGAQSKARGILEAARQRDEDATLHSAVDFCREKLRATEEAVEAARHALFAASPEEARLRLEAKTKAAELIQKDIESTNKLANDLEIELRALGQRGLGERAQELSGELEQTQALTASLASKAEATQLLYQTLRLTERAAKETFMAPVRRRVQPYLNLLMPGSELILGDDDLSISHLRRGGKDEPFESLSVGTREQLAVLTRLAFADLLREQGHSTAVVLDDALVYADDQRFESMLYVLRRAAQHQQILVLTCRERDYVSAGFPVIRLSTCRAASPAGIARAAV
jgi:energy-coupling factor transporter ATP-binding protein EcfA2